MDLTEEAIKIIQETACKAQVGTLHKLPGAGREVLMQIGGDLRPYEVKPECRAHKVNTLADLIAYAERLEADKIVVWHGIAGVVLVIDDSDRRDRVTFPLTFSERFRLLQQLAKEKPSFPQDKFIRLLRIGLGLDNTAVVAQFRKLDWETGYKGVSEALHGDARLSKQVIAKVQGIDELPEELRVPVPVYQQAGERQEYVVVCAVEIDAVNRCFQLLPLPDELERVLDIAQDDIRKRLDGELEGVAIYYGTP